MEQTQTLFPKGLITTHHTVPRIEYKPGHRTFFLPNSMHTVYTPPVDTLVQIKSRIHAKFGEVGIVTKTVCADNVPDQLTIRVGYVQVDGKWQPTDNLITTIALADQVQSVDNAQGGDGTEKVEHIVSAVPGTKG